MATVRELITKWGFTVDDSDLKKFEKNLNNVKTAVKVIGGLAIGAAGSMFGLAQSTAKAGDEIAKAARIAGIGVEAFQELEFAADLAGISSSEYATSMRFLTRNISEAAAGTGEAKDAFQRLGIRLRNERTGELRKTEDVLLDLAEGFKNTKSQADRVSFAMDILGRSGAKMSNLLVQGKAAISAQRQELRQLGLITEEETKQAEEYIDAQTRLTAALVGTKNAIGARLLPVITKYTDKLREFFLQNRKIINQKIDRAINLTVKAFKKLKTFISIVAKSLKPFIEMLGGTEKALKLLTKALLIFIGLKFVSAIGGMVQGLFGLLSAMKKVGFAATLTNLKVMAIPLAIGAAFIAAGLIIQDFFVFLEGGKSVFGGVLAKFGLDVGKTREKIKTGLSFLDNLFSDISNRIEVLFDVISSHINELTEDIQKLAKRISNAFDEAEPDVNNFFDSIRTEINLLIADIQRLPETIVNAFKEMGESIKKSLTFSFPSSPSDVFGARPRPARLRPTIIPQGKISEQILKNTLSLAGEPIRNPAFNRAQNNNAQNIKINSPIYVTVPPGTPGDRIGPTIKQSFKESLSEVLRETNRQVAPAHN